MPVYKYVAVNAQKQKVKGKFIADNEKQLAASLAKKNLFLVSSSVDKGGTPSAFFTTGTGKVQLKELTTFCRQFAIMITAGITVLECLNNLKKQNYSHYFKSILQVIYDDVKSGSMLSAAVDKHAKVFPHFFRSMVHVGEASGRLNEVFESLADYYESDEKIRRKAKSALSYPLMLLAMTIGIVILMLTFVVPTFKDTMSKLDVTIEGFTKTVYDISDFLTANWRFLLVGVIFVVGVLILLLQTKKGQYVADAFKLYAPFIGRVQVELITARYARAFSILLSSGMPLSEALDTLEIIIGNQCLQKRFKTVKDEVKHGVSLTKALQNLNFFPDILIQMVSVGEKTAALGEVMTRTYKYFDERVETSLNALTAKIQPVMLLIMGVTIGSLFLAVYSPMLSIMNQL
ncbi:MAG: type II secretion system F family protein [Clostridiales bacterium]|nr:type II secretion system F family protein [Clostridiales bacterium]